MTNRTGSRHNDSGSDAERLEQVAFREPSVRVPYCERCLVDVYGSKSQFESPEMNRVNGIKGARCTIFESPPEWYHPVEV